MSAYFFQSAPGDFVEIKPENVGVGPHNVVREHTIATLSLPAGSYIVIAKFDVAAGLSTHSEPHTSTYYLSFAGAKDKAHCHLNQSHRETVTMIVAGTNSLAEAVQVGGGGRLQSEVRLYCDQVFPDAPKIYYISITAIPVDGVEKLSK